MNWGTKIVIGLAAFMSFVIVLVIRAVTSDKDDLVVKDYYEQGLNYDAEYQDKQNVTANHAAPALTLKGENLFVSFTAPARGQLRLMHPNDAAKDKVMKFDTGAGATTALDVRSLERINWRIRIEWVTDGKPYMYDASLKL